MGKDPIPGSLQADSSSPERGAHSLSFRRLNKT